MTGAISLEAKATGPIATKGELRQVIRDTANSIVAEIIKQWSADISGAGKFGARWTQGFTTETKDTGTGVEVDVKHSIPFFKTFTYTHDIFGKPMLWIPLSFATDAKGILARNYGPLFRVNRQGKAPLLMAPGKPAQPKYFGKTSVHMPQKFRTYEIAAQVVARSQDFFASSLKKAA